MTRKTKRRAYDVRTLKAVLRKMRCIDWTYIPDADSPFFESMNAVSAMLAQAARKRKSRGGR